MLSPAPFEKRKGGIVMGLVRVRVRVRVRRALVRRVRDWKLAYISEGAQHRILKLKLWSLCKNSISKMLLDF